MISKADRSLEAVEHNPKAFFLPDSTMKISGAVLSMVLLTAYFIYQVYASPDAVSTPQNCCFEFTSKKIPLKLLVNYKTTSSMCSKEAVILVTKRGLNICANPKDQWVQDLMKNLDNMKAKTMKPMKTETTSSYPDLTSHQSTTEELFPSSLPKLLSDTSTII
ncbi:C-C motif chemokine 13-like [Dromiciops gliroides]|uniref:C-C motif chemokine 13-like n=1 Tax=Dromiciops gliroides TaxID=33562 RepID=UPI001CC82971|nr:C-C motif chemokine 13-like [Dromiciops gliroides]